MINIFENDNFCIDYDEKTRRYRASYFEEFHFCDECWFDEYHCNDSPNVSVGDIVQYSYPNRESEICKISMLQQKADKTWKVRLSKPNGAVFDITLDKFNKYCKKVSD